MIGLTPNLLARACRIFLDLAYPLGEETIPPGRRLIVLDELGAADLGRVLVPPLAQSLFDSGGACHGYSLRLGSASFPHLKLQVIVRGDETCVFSVDTHDALRLDPDHPDAEGWAQLQASNRQLKMQIEKAWEANGLCTFNSLLRRELGVS
jgi:hypothetical protein